MVPDTQFTAALIQPSKVVQTLYEDAADKAPSAFAAHVEQQFRATFQDPEARAKVPLLTPQTIQERTGKLVRFRCMIQDTGLGTEVFLAQTADGSSGMFGAETDDVEMDQVDSSKLSERSVMYALSVPGRSAWLKSAWGETDLSTLSESPQRIQEVRDRIAAAAGDAQPPRLVAISKLHPPSSILAAHVQAKQLHFGENYVQELVDKAKVLPRSIRWHFVGGLQSNKGKLLASVPNLYLLETLDSVKGANVMQKELAKVQREQPLFVYLQVNTSGEQAKSGLPPIAEGEEGGALLELAVHVMTKCPLLRLKGLMTIGAAANSVESREANPDFDRLIETRSNLLALLRKQGIEQEAYKDLLEGDGGLELSMGMSADLEAAIKAGSDNVRVGTDCFGKRPGSREQAMAGMKHELENGLDALAAYEDALPQKAPIPEEEHVGSLVKLYDVDAAEKIRTTQVVEVVGILDTAALPHSDWQDTGATPQEVPCIHALFVDPLDLNAAPAATMNDREGLIAHLASGLGGDLLAAELVLLCSIARIHSRRGSLNLGGLTLNLSHFPTPPSPTSTPTISRILADLLPAVVDLELSLSSLNDPKHSFGPRSTGGSTGLSTGRLQLASGSMLLINEGSMNQGQLLEPGLLNIKTLSTLLESQKLAYHFPYSQFEFETDINALILSQGKSFLPFQVRCPLHSNASPEALYGEPQKGAEKWREAVLNARSSETAKKFVIASEVSEHIQHAFVEARKEEHGGATQEDLVRRMALVRLVAISKDEQELSIATWDEAVSLDARVQERLTAGERQS